MSALIALGISVVMLIVGRFAGRAAEKRHLAALARVEERHADVLLSDMKRFSPAADPVARATLVVGQVVVANDYFKSFVAALRSIVGGEVRSYRGLMERARREAIARMIEDATGRGFDAVCNVRIEMVPLGSSVVTYAVLASGTAYKRPIAAA